MIQANTALSRATSLILIPVILGGCSAYHLTDHNPQYLLNKHSEATKGVCAVAPFTFEPIEQDDVKMMSKEDLGRWNSLFFEAVNRADICGRAVKVASINAVPSNTAFVIDGKVTDFSFEKNWVPMFFPGWIGLTVFSLGIYGLAAGPMTTTQVDFGFTVNLKNPKTLQLLETIPEKYESTDIQTLYSDSQGNSYDNPGHAFEPTLNDAFKKLSEAMTRNGPQRTGLSPKEAAIRQLGELREKGKISEKEYLQGLERLVN